MNRFVISANLPQAVDQLIIGEKYRELLDEELRKLKIEPIYCPENPYIDKRLSGHVDLSVLHVGGNTVYLSPYLKDSEFTKKLKKRGSTIVYPQIKMGKAYPEDCQLNLCLVDNAVFFARNISEKSVIQFFSEKGFRTISVKQGYCKCSICIVNERSLITSDRGVYLKALENNFDCLLIHPGYISLPGFDYGFIGGSTFKISDDRLCFTGNLNSHPDKERILEFLDQRNVRPIFLTDLPIFDIGSTVPLTER